MSGFCPLVYTGSYLHVCQVMAHFAKILTNLHVYFINYAIHMTLYDLKKCPKSLCMFIFLLRIYIYNIITWERNYINMLLPVGMGQFPFCLYMYNVLTKHLL